MSLWQSSAKCRFICLLFVRTFCSRLFATFFDFLGWLSVSSPRRSVGTPSPSPFPRGSCSQTRSTPCNLYSYLGTLLKDLASQDISNQGLRFSENQNFVYQKTRQTGTLILSSYSAYVRMRIIWHFFRARAGVVLGSELRLLMSFSWPVFPGLDQVLFPPWFSWFLGFDSKTVQRSALCISRRELSNAYLLAKIGVDTAENEPLEVWGKIQFNFRLPPRSV